MYSYMDLLFFIELAAVPSLKSVIREQNNACRVSQWQCKDGSCINIDSKCDGVVDCPDGSDETHTLFRERRVKDNWFRCTYGACVDGTAPCNGIQECADNSDELLPNCRNATRDEIHCLDGSTIAAYKHCDGVRDCADGSDETLRSCAGKTCLPYLFQCAYGACSEPDANCNGVTECADGSDEAEELCGHKHVTGQSAVPSMCVLPEYPEHGSYVVSGVPHAKPGMSLEFVAMNYTCDKGYGIIDRSDVVCINGWWSDTTNPLKCVRFCQLKKHASVEYKCVLSGTNNELRTCNEYEPKGTNVQPECRTPNYYSEESLRYMVCEERGEWNYIAKCQPECGTVTPTGTALIWGGWNAKKGELPWQAGIYTKNMRPYMQICGGTLISNTIVLSAAHCFWANDAQVPKEQYAVGLGKLYRNWILKQDYDVQQSEIKDIHIPPYFIGRIGNYQADIAVVILENTIIYKSHIRPLCLSFDTKFEKIQLNDGNVGKVAGWGVIDDAGTPSQVLKVSEVIFMEASKCIAQTPLAFKPYITVDKICTGYANDTGVCRGYSGGGLAFPNIERWRKRFYLRGIVSTAHSTNDACNGYTVHAYTNIMPHEHFIKQYWTSYD